MTKSQRQDPEEYLLSLFAKHNRVFLGDELKEKIVTNLQKSDAAARKIVERFASKGLIESSAPVSFGRKTFAYFVPGYKITFEDLLGITRLRRPPLFRLLSAIKKCGGILSYYEALKISASQLTKTKSKTTGLDVLLEELHCFKAISVSADKNNVKYLIANYIEPSEVEPLMARHFSMMLVDASLLYDVLISLNKFNLIDNRYIRYRHRKTPSLGAPHNNFTWDAFAYTRTTGINTVYGKRKGASLKQALIVVDMVVSRRYELFDFDGFKDRVQVLHNNTKAERKVIPILVYREISKEALSQARGFGVLTYSLATFFGDHIFDVIDNITAVKLSENTAQGLLIDPVQTITNTLDLIENSGNSFNLQNLTGDFFQSLMFQLFSHLYPGCPIEQAKKLPAMDETNGGKKMYEYDLVIHAHRDNEIIAIELKGSMQNATITLGAFDKKNTIKWFFGRTFPSFAKHFNGPLHQNLKVVSAFITSGKFDPEGQTFLSTLNGGKLKANLIDVGYDGKKLLQLVENQSLTLLKETLKRHFIKSL